MKKKKLLIALICLAILLIAVGFFVLTKDIFAPGDGGDIESPIDDLVTPTGGDVQNSPEEDASTSAVSHSFSPEWQTDATEHWQICSEPNCPEHANLGAHSGGEASCTEQAICSICGAPYGEALGHDFEQSLTVDAEPTCTEPGSKSRHCARCKEVTDETAIPATGHSFSSKWTYGAYGHWHAATCGHSVTDAYAPHGGGTATCTEAAICVACGEAYGTPLGHDFALSYTVDIKPTCTEAGRKSHHCKRCGLKTDVTVIHATGHTFATAWTSDGTNHWHICTNAGCTAANDLASHTGGAATCTEQAACEVCDVSYGAPLGHDFSLSWTSDGDNHWHACTRAGCTQINESAAHFGGAATCTEQAECAACGEAYGTPLGHDFALTFTTDLEPTCTEAGSKSRHCVHAPCDEIADVTAIPALGHSFSAGWSNDATSHWHICTRTGCTEQDAYAAHAPDEDDGDCTTPLLCSVCEYVLTPAELSHSWNDELTNDTTNHWYVCTTEGCTKVNALAAHAGGTATCTDKAACSACGAPYGSALGHSFSAEWAVSSLGHFHRPTCGHVLDDEAISYTPHSGGTATCTEQKVCEVCEAPYGPPLLHQFSTDWTSDETDHWHVCTREGCAGISAGEAHFGGEATCTEAALCAVCGAPYGEPLGHDFADELTVDVEATCASAGMQSYHCVRCAATKDAASIPKLAHSYGPWSTVTPATCMAAGVERRVCGSNSAHTEERALPIDPAAHKWDWNRSKGTVTAPSTCDQDGETTFACGNGCGHTEKLPIPRSAHSHAVNFAQPAHGTIAVTYADGTPIASGTAVACGTVLSVTATPDYGYHLAANSLKVMISGVDRYIKASGTFIVRGSTAAVEATMALNSYTITALAAGGATELTIAPSGSINVAHGASQTFTITPGTDFLVKKMTVDGVDMGAVTSYTFTDVQSAHEITADYVRAHRITASAGGGGAISPEGVTKVADGADKTYAITPGTGYRVKDVLVDGVSVGAVTSYTFENVTSEIEFISSEHTIHATFVRVHTITLSVVGGSLGTVMGSSVTADEGADVTFTAAPNAGCTLSIWVDGALEGTISEGDGEERLSYTFTDVSAPHTIMVSFAVKKEITHAITSSAGGNGAISPNGTTNVQDGADQAYTITPGTGYKVANVLVDGASVGAVTSYTFTSVTAPHIISATFEQLTYTIAASAGTGGTISSPGETAVAYNGSKSYTIAANANHIIKDVLVDGVSVGAVTSYTFSNVNAPHTISATFDALTNTITASASAGGTISSPGETPVAYNGSKTYDIAANTGHRIADVLVDGASVGAVTSYTFNNVTAPHKIVARFEKLTYEITAPLPVHGSIGPRVSTFVPHGGSQTYTVAPDSGYAIKDVLVDGVSVGPVTSYTFTNVTAPHTISATFGFAITVSAGANGTISPAGAVVEHGGSVTFTIAPNAGYIIDNVTADGSDKGRVFSYSFTNVTAAHALSATFAKAQYSVTVAYTNFGSISLVGGTKLAQMGDTISLQIEPVRLFGYRLKEGSLTVTGASGTTYPVTVAADAATATFTMPAESVTVTAAFERPTYSVTVGTVTHGGVVLLTEGPYYCNNRVTVSLTPESIAYRLKEGSLTVTDEGGTTHPVNVAADGNTASFRVPAQNVTVTAEFERLETIEIWPNGEAEYMLETDDAVYSMFWAEQSEFVGVLHNGELLDPAWWYLVSGPPTFAGDEGKTRIYAEHGITCVRIRAAALDELSAHVDYVFTFCFKSGTVDRTIAVVPFKLRDGFNR